MRAVRLPPVLQAFYTHGRRFFRLPGTSLVQTPIPDGEDEDMKRLAAPQDEKKEGLIYIHSECLHEHEDCMAAERAAMEAATKKRSSR